MDVVVSNMAWLPKDCLGQANVILLKKRLTLVPKQSGYGEEGESESPVIYMYRENATHLGIPRQYYVANKKDEHQEIIRVGEGHPLTPNTNKIVLRPEDQEPIAQQVVDYLNARPYGGGVIRAHTGYGKCHGRGTKILMFDGSLKCVEDIKLDDVVMGPDGGSRRVLKIGSGRGELFKIIPKGGGNSFTVNLDHILHLRVTGSKKIGNYVGGDAHYLSLKDWLTLSEGKKHLLKLERSSGYEGSEVVIDFDPYMIGMWLGDGTLMTTDITNCEPELYSYFNDFAAKNNLIAHQKDHGSRCESWAFVTRKGRNNPYLSFLRDHCGLGVSKRVPSFIKMASRKQRLDFLAGVLDSDGYLCNKKVFELVVKEDSLFADICFVARSLGFRVSCKKKTASIKSTGFVGVYNLMIISGPVDQIPVKLSRKKPEKLNPNKNHLLTGFDVESVGVDDWFGFELDQDHLYLLDDFTINHNTTVSIEIARRINRTTLILVHKTPLKDQWIERIRSFYPSAKIGSIQGSECDYRGKDFVIGMFQSIMKDNGDKYPEELWSYFGLVLVDETHRAGAAAFSTVAPKFNAKYMLGLSATPRRSDGCEDAFRWVIGNEIAVPPTINKAKPIIYVRETGFQAVRREYVDRNSGETKMFDMNRYKKPTLLGFITKNNFRNDLIAKDIIQALKAGRSPLVMAERLNVLESIADRLESLAPSALGKRVSNGFYVGGKSKEELEVAARCDVVYATLQLAKEGIDIEKLDTMFLVTPISDPEQLIGRIGRARTVRNEDGSTSVIPPKNRPMVVDYVDSELKVFKGLFFSRLRHYQNLKCEMIGMKI